MGGLALAVWKHVRATRDVDLMIGIGEHRVEEVLRIALAAGIRPKRHPSVVPLGGLDVIPMLYEPPDAFVDLQIDLLLARSESSFRSLRRRVPTHLPGLDITIAVLACEDLILHKLLAGRLIDRVDAAALMRINRHAIDWEYLGRSAAESGVANELVEAWTQALPGQPLPAAFHGD